MDSGALTVKAFCERYGISHSKTYEEIAAGRLKAVKSGRKTLVPIQAAADWLAKLPALDLSKEVA